MDNRQQFIAVKTGVILERVQTTPIEVLKKNGSKLYFKCEWWKYSTKQQTLNAYLLKEWRFKLLWSAASPQKVGNNTEKASCPFCRSRDTGPRSHTQRHELVTALKSDCSFQTIIRKRCIPRGGPYFDVTRMIRSSLLVDKDYINEPLQIFSPKSLEMKVCVMKWTRIEGRLRRVNVNLRKKKMEIVKKLK